MSKLTDFEHGVLYSAALVTRLFDQSVIAAAIVREASLGRADIRSLDEFEKSQLVKLQQERDIAFTS